MMTSIHKVFKQVIGRWLSFVNSPGLGNKLVFPPENHKGKSLSHTAVSSKLLATSWCKKSTFFHQKLQGDLGQAHCSSSSFWSFALLCRLSVLTRLWVSQNFIKCFFWWSVSLFSCRFKLVFHPWTPFHLTAQGPDNPDTKERQTATGDLQAF